MGGVFYPMTSAELRERFLAFFEHACAHTRVPSDSLIPSGDPTVLFTSAGMNQFKDCFLGKRTDLRRATSCQKCLRTGDLENVGKTPSHHSFFEMLGNFSFGDYFKADAIHWAWEFLTGTVDYRGTPTTPDRARYCLPLPAGKLWVSVYEEDEEAYSLWRKLGVPEERIKRFGQADNFWPANAPNEGPNGPCGPCSEIYYDLNGQVASPQSVEIWNLVFTQYDRQPDGSLKPLPKPNIDTGMGFERLVRVLHDMQTDYETELFAPLMQAIDRLGWRAGAQRKDWLYAQRAIADHMRAIVFLISERLRPSNESRGYVLRLLIRRAYRLGLRALAVDPETAGRDQVPGGDAIQRIHPRAFLYRLVDSVRNGMEGSPYAPELTAKYEHIIQVLSSEESQFAETLQTGESRLRVLLDALKCERQHSLPGEKAFELYDTYGFPLELTVDIAAEQGFTVDRMGFETALKAQQERSRAASQFSGGVFVTDALKIREVLQALPPKDAQFVGYESLASDAAIKGLWDGTSWVNRVAAGQAVGIVLDRSPFYGEAGGQVGDAGSIEGQHGVADVERTTWVDETLIHHATVRAGTLAVAETVRAAVEAQRRLSVARSHTAAHMLHWALRKVLGPETVQAGSFVEVERVRFDFSTLGGLHEEQRLQVEQLVNERIRAADQVQTATMRLEEAKRAGALALFGEKYGQQVRVVSIGDYSQELCGGTHLLHTGSIGLFRIVDESSIAAGTRRIEAIVGQAALIRQQQESQLLKDVAQRLSRPPHEALAGLDELLQQLRNADKDLKTLKQELAHVQAKQLVADAKQVDGVTLITAQIDGADRELLTALADAIKGRLTVGVVVLASVDRTRSVGWVMSVTADLVKRGLHAGNVLKTISAITKGGGGGRPDFAQAGGKDATKIPEALKQAESLIHKALS
ncbi:MAG: alanine--tRNA ligase [Candidatus Omnitrophica bacterium]|nr:alanine--tRNA ligase [Candidatus Omnitrophota bacterium]